jgi:hypothetical protein
MAFDGRWMNARRAWMKDQNRMRYYMEADDLAVVTRDRARQRKCEMRGHLLALLGMMLAVAALLNGVMSLHG